MYSLQFEVTKENENSVDAFHIKTQVLLQDMLSDLFYILSFSVLMMFSILTIVISFMIIFVFATSAKCRTITNMHLCNVSAGLALLGLNRFLVSIYGLHEDWAVNQPFCKFQAYMLTVESCIGGYGYATQAIGRLCVTVFYKNNYLHTYRIHCYIIALSYIICLILPIVPFFFDGAYVFEEESRICTLTPKYLNMSTYIGIVAFVIPLNIGITIYVRIIQYARAQRRIIAPIPSNTTNSRMPNLKREMKVARNMLLMVLAFVIAGIVNSVLVIWLSAGVSTKPPESLYLLDFVSISLGAALYMIAQVTSNKEIKTVMRQYLQCRYNRIESTTTNIRQIIVQSKD